jgi:hypothetical protein
MSHAKPAGGRVRAPSARQSEPALRLVGGADVKRRLPAVPLDDGPEPGERLLAAGRWALLVDHHVRRRAPGDN